MVVREICCIFHKQKEFQKDMEDEIAQVTNEKEEENVTCLELVEV